MKLEGIHHITAITGHAQANLDFYAGVLGLRLVKKTVNQDDPGVYHLFYADEDGSPGSDLTFFEYPNAAPGRAGAGMVHRVCWRVASPDALDFWERRLAGRGVAVARTGGGRDGGDGGRGASGRDDGGDSGGGGGLIFTDPEGLAHELSVSDAPDEPLPASTPEIPADLALLGFDGVRVHSSQPHASTQTLGEVLGFTAQDDDGLWQARGRRRGSFYAYDPAPEGKGRQGAGTVHHVAFASEVADHEDWQQRLAQAGLRPTPVIDRFYFRSIYFREPSGVLMEIATLGPGFAVDEDPERLGERLSLPPAFEPMRERIESILTPLASPRAGATG